jgi:hypothetical protein
MSNLMVHLVLLCVVMFVAMAHIQGRNYLPSELGLYSNVVGVVGNINIYL